MPILSAETQFRKGVVALAEENAKAACGHFQAAIQIERQHAVPRPQMRYLSFYGLALALAQGATVEAIRACETACRRDFFNPDLFLNLGRVFLLAGKTTRALETLERGLKLSPNHIGLRVEMSKVERRAPRPLSLLPRDHTLNKTLGRLRASLMDRGRRTDPRARTEPS